MDKTIKRAFGPVLFLLAGQDLSVLKSLLNLSEGVDYNFMLAGLGIKAICPRRQGVRKCGVPTLCMAA